MRNGQKHTNAAEGEEVFWINAYAPIEKQSNKDWNIPIHLADIGSSTKVPLISWFLIMTVNFCYIYITNCG